jgi:hypothetical protein
MAKASNFQSESSLQAFLHLFPIHVDQISGSPEGNRLLLRFCKDITNGLNYLHNVEQIPIDLSTRSCHLTHDMTVKALLFQVE